MQNRFFSFFYFLPALLLISCPSQKEGLETEPEAVSVIQEEHDDHGHDHDHTQVPDPNMVVLPNDVKNAMTDSGSYNLDLTKTGLWTMYKIQLRDTEQGPGTDTVFIRESGHFNKDKKTGVWKFSITRDKTLPQNWELTDIIEFKDDKIHGSKKVYKNGRLFFVEHYKNDEQDSLSYYFDDFGNLSLEVNYRNGKRHGMLKQYDAAGKLKSIITYDKNVQSGYYAHYYPGGKVIKEEGTSEDGKATGSWKLYHPNGQLWTERTYRDGKPWEVISNFTSEGKSRPAGTLKKGTGTMILYDAAGNEAETEVYQDGEKVN